MADVGIDIGAQRSQSIEEFLGDPPDLVISVCDNARESCPVFPERVANLHWPFPDPADATGTDEEIATVFADVREQIRERIEAWLHELAALAPEESR